MAKPTITKRVTKGAALTYSELDTNFQNLADATLTLTADTAGTQVTADLNGNITLVAGTGVTITGDNTAKTITINSGAAQNTFSTIAVSGQSNVVADSSSDTLTFSAGSGISITTNSGTDTVSISTSGVARNPLIADLNMNGFALSSGGVGNINVDDDINFPDGTGPNVPGAGTLLCRGGTVKLQCTGDPGLEISGAVLSGTPSNTSTVSQWLKITVNGSTKYIPLYA